MEQYFPIPNLGLFLQHSYIFVNIFVENLRKKLKCRSQALVAHPRIVLDSWNMIRENQFLLPDKNTIGDGGSTAL